MQIKPIDGFPGYFITDAGGVFSLRKTKPGRAPKVVKPSVDAYGYLVVKLFQNLERKYFKVHRLVAMTFLEKPDGKNNVCHRNDIKTDNRLENLYWGTQQENVRDMVANGRSCKGRGGQKGETNNKAKLTKEQVLEIRKATAGKRKFGIMRQLAAKYGVSNGAIGRIANGDSWSHLPLKPYAPARPRRQAAVAATVNDPPPKQGSGPTEGPNE